MSPNPSVARKRPSFFLPLVLGIAVLAIAGIVWGIVALTRPAEGAEAGAPEARLPAGTGMGVVELNVSDLDLVRDYYVDAVGLEVLSEEAGTAVLGFDIPLIELHEGSGAAQASPTEAGLYHSAILYPDGPALAEALMSISAVAPESFQGSADHAVSEAFYFTDPEGNGLELYIDRPADEWVWEDGEVQMGSAPLDPNAFISEHLGNDSAGGAVLGHVHLKVGDLDDAEVFYSEILGFAVTARSDGALFYAADGYHHHVATNTWQSNGAGVRTNETGLGSLSITVADAAALDALADRLEAAGTVFERDGAVLFTADPWGNTVRVSAA